MTKWTFLLSLLVAGIAAPYARGDAATDELKRLEGAWNLSSAVDSGERLPADSLKGATVVFAGNKMTMVAPDGEEKTEFTIKINPSKSPKEIDATPEAGPGKGKVLPGAAAPGTAADRGR